MIQRIKLIVVSLMLALGLAFAMASPALAATGAAGDAKDDVCKGVVIAGGNCGDNGRGLSEVLTLIINIISVIAGFAAVIMIMLGGLRYTTSGGDSSKVAGAKSTITYAIIGLVVVVFAQVIVRYVAGSAGA